MPPDHADARALLHLGLMNVPASRAAHQSSPLPGSPFCLPLPSAHPIDRKDGLVAELDGLPLALDLAAVLTWTEHRFDLML